MRSGSVYTFRGNTAPVIARSQRKRIGHSTDTNIDAHRTNNARKAAVLVQAAQLFTIFNAYHFPVNKSGRAGRFPSRHGFGQVHPRAPNTCFSSSSVSSGHFFILTSWLMAPFMASSKHVALSLASFLSHCELHEYALASEHRRSKHSSFSGGSFPVQESRAWTSSCSTSPAISVMDAAKFSPSLMFDSLMMI